MFMVLLFGLISWRSLECGIAPRSPDYMLRGGVTGFVIFAILTIIVAVYKTDRWLLWRKMPPIPERVPHASVVHGGEA